jgi:hypothetical protein
MGGIPWSISDMPFTDKPTQVIGYSSCKKGSNSSIFSICATLNNTFNLYFSDVVIQNQDESNQL